MLLQIPKYDSSAMPLLRRLHWLPIKARIEYKINILVFKCLNGNAPEYLKSLVCIDHPNYNLRSSGGIILTVSKLNAKIVERLFHVAGPKLWNALPCSLRSIVQEYLFKKKLKTHLFCQYL